MLKSQRKAIEEANKANVISLEEFLEVEVRCVFVCRLYSFTDLTLRSAPTASQTRIDPHTVHACYIRSVEDLQNSYKRSLLKNGTEAPLQEFLLFLLAMALPHETPESELQPIWDSILSVAVDLCNEGLPVPVPAKLKTKKSKAKKSKASELKLSESNPSESTVTSKLQALLHS